MRHGRRKAVVGVLAAAAVSGWILWGNKSITVTTVAVTCRGLPQAFAGYTIAQVSDLHNTEFGTDNERLLEKLREAEPDLIAITGDLVDSRRTDLACALSFAAAATQIAPTCYVPGNHEARLAAYGELEDDLREAGVRVLRNECTWIFRGEDGLAVLGLDDPAFSDGTETTEETLREISPGTDAFTLLLSHRPELLESYAACDVDLVLSGHAHGGQFRLPIIGGLFAPNQGVLPEYDAGVFQMENTTMVVSRGLGNSLFPFRVNNNPELVIVTLQPERT